MYLGVGISALKIWHFALWTRDSDKKFKIVDWGVINLIDEHSNKKMCCYMKDINDPSINERVSAIT